MSCFSGKRNITLLPRLARAPFKSFEMCRSLVTNATKPTLCCVLMRWLLLELWIRLCLPIRATLRYVARQPHTKMPHHHSVFLLKVESTGSNEDTGTPASKADAVLAIVLSESGRHGHAARRSGCMFRTFSYEPNTKSSCRETSSATRERRRDRSPTISTDRPRFSPVRQWQTRRRRSTLLGPPAGFRFYGW